MRAVDTQVLVRLIARDDSAQLKAAEAFVSPGAWVSQIVLVETVWVLETVLALDAERLAQAVDMLLNHQNLSVQDAEIAADALRHYRQRPSLGFSDCLVLECARKAGHLPLGTFDRDLARIAGGQRL
jgi:predicted nucleic-acid-binding protein